MKNKSKRFYTKETANAKRGVWDTIKNGLKRYTWPILCAVILVAVVYPVYSYYAYGYSKLDRYRVELSKGYKVATGHVTRTNPKHEMIYYEFVVDGARYEGFSNGYGRYAVRQDAGYGAPKIGTPVEVYYKEGDPEVNLISDYIR
ncbi:MAG: hypothetical protein MJZ13_03435 [Bacteroidales bacterium]|nr:hypothetical protein [Bacteroidales bacterium]